MTRIWNHEAARGAIPMRKSHLVSDRRDFLKLAATSAAAIVAGNTASAQQSETSVAKLATDSASGAGR